MKSRFTFAALTLCLLFSFNTYAEEIREWNFLVFLNGVNNLDGFGKMNINQMEEIGSTDKMNVLVQWGSLSNKNVQRMLIEKDNNPAKITSPVIQNLGSADMGDYKELIKFVEWSHQNYPAKHYFIAVWNHGSGWHFTRDGTAVQDISYDDRTGHHITTEELGLAMRTASQSIGQKIDIYGSDACLMGMVEVADEMSTAVNYFVGSQDLEPGEGWPYAKFLGKWVENIDTLTPADVSRLLSAEYLNSYSDGGVYGSDNVTMSVYDLGQIEQYKASIKELTKEFSQLSKADLAKVKNIATKTKYFYWTDYRDLVDFLNKVKVANMTLPSLNKVIAAHKKFVLANDQNEDSNTFGTSIWLPTSATTFSTNWDRYEKMSFHNSTGWGTFLKALLNNN